MKYVLIPALLLMSFAASAAQVSRVTIIEYGIYTTETTSAKRDAKGVLQSVVKDIRHVETTTTVPAQRNVEFGFRFRVDGNPQGTQISLTKIVTFPSAGLHRPGAAQPLRSSQTKITPTIGKTFYEGYRFDDPWELVAGPWTIEIWDGKRKLASQQFNVVQK